jgi:hypothetical protein
MIGVPPPNRDRFLAAIAERVPPDSVQALFLFAPMRQGAVETCVAVVAVDPPPVRRGEDAAQGSTVGSAEQVPIQERSPTASVPPGRDPGTVVLTARYRHTIKGPDRGKWELEILEQADAPLITVEMVVRGVQQRIDDTRDPERLGADALRSAVAEGVWTQPPR